MYLFSEDILKSGHAVWISPDGGGLVFATFDDSKVEEVQFELYGDGDGDGNPGSSSGESDPYPKVSTMRYPKAGSRNPDVSLWLVSLADMNNLQSVRLSPPSTFPHA